MGLHRKGLPGRRPPLSSRVDSTADRDGVDKYRRAVEVPVYLRGGGTMYAGGANPHAGGLVIDLSRMTRVLELDLARGVVVVEAGIRFADLLAQLETHGQTVGIVPLTGFLASKHGGSDCAVFDASYFRTLRFEANYWYSFAGYFTRSRCAILMTSLPCDQLVEFCAAVDGLRARWPAFVWGAATVVCRRGLHGGAMAFYDEQTQWAAMQEVIEDAIAVLRAAGCVPYKSARSGQVKCVLPALITACWNGLNAVLIRMVCFRPAISG